MNKKKIIATVCVATAATAVIGGSLAYLQDVKTENIRLTGNDHIYVQEIDAQLEDTTVFPGKTVDFNPTIKVDATADAFVFMQLEGDAIEYIENSSVNGAWQRLNGHDGVYYQEIQGSGDVRELPVFENGQIAFSKDLRNEDLEAIPQDGVDIQIKGAAIQRQYLENNGDAEAAWEILNN